MNSFLKWYAQHANDCARWCSTQVYIFAFKVQQRKIDPHCAFPRSCLLFRLFTYSNDITFEMHDKWLNRNYWIWNSRIELHCDVIPCAAFAIRSTLLTICICMDCTIWKCIRNGMMENPQWNSQHCKNIENLQGMCRKPEERLFRSLHHHRPLCGMSDCHLQCDILHYKKMSRCTSVRMCGNKFFLASNKIDYLRLMPLKTFIWTRMRVRCGPPVMHFRYAHCAEKLCPCPHMSNVANTFTHVRLGIGIRTWISQFTRGKSQNRPYFCSVCMKYRNSDVNVVACCLEIICQCTYTQSNTYISRNFMLCLCKDNSIVCMWMYSLY